MQPPWLARLARAHASSSTTAVQLPQQPLVPCTAGIDAPACSWTGPHTGAYGADLPPWAWAGIGAAGALLLVAAAAVLLQLWQRRRSPSVQQEAQHKPAAGHEAPQTPGADRSSGRASSLSGSLPWPAAWLAGSSGGKAELPRGLPSTNSILEALSATGSAMPQGTWKAR